MVKRKQGRQKTKWRDEIRFFVGVTWNRLTADRDEWRRFVLSGLIEAYDDNDDEVVDRFKYIFHPISMTSCSVFHPVLSFVCRDVKHGHSFTRVICGQYAEPRGLEFSGSAWHHPSH